MTEPRSASSRSHVVGSLVGAVTGAALVLFLLGTFVWSFLIPARLKARWIDGLAGGVASAQFATTADGQPVILVSEGIASYRHVRSGASGTRTSGYNYFWLTSLDARTGAVLARTDLPRGQAKEKARLLVAAPGRVWVLTGGTWHQRDPATGELLPTTAPPPGDEALAEAEGQRGFVWARRHDGTRFDLVESPQAPGNEAIRRLRITPPQDSPRDAPELPDLPNPRILVDQLTGGPIVAENPPGIYLATYDQGTDNATVMRLDAGGGVVWRRAADELPDFGLDFEDVRVRTAHLADRHLILLMGERLICFDPADGQVQWIYGRSTAGAIDLWFKKLRQRLLASHAEDPGR